MIRYLFIFVAAMFMAILFQCFVAGNALNDKMLSLNLSVSDLLIIFLLLSNLVLLIMFLCRYLAREE
ncbi:MAG: hypothetical protein PHC75_06405 [Burkholderiales bacterium]|nr:hypothetical protein [Burkholderiales bacterium]